MKKQRSLITMLLVIAMLSVFTVGCKSNNKSKETTNNNSKEKKVKEFTAFLAVPGTELSDDNRIMEAIAKKIGAKVKQTWLTGQTAAESVGAIIAGGEYPDFIDGSEGTSELISAGALIAIDEYWDDYPNIKNYLTEAQWNQVRNEDGHIYIMPQFGITYGKDTQTFHNDEAFWIQIRVLEWAGYPEIETLDEYFDVINRYVEANPTMEDGTTNIGYEILCDDWRYYCLENPPFFLDGYPNDGCCIVDPETLAATNYNTTPTAKKYFAKLNEEFKKGIVDPETFTASYDQYIAKLSAGRVCGMVDQYWNFKNAEDSLVQQGLDDSCYVPVGVVIEEGIEERYHSEATLDVSNGLGITTSCKDIEGALQFVNDMLSQEIQTMRFWGIEGEDYAVDEEGLFYRNETQRKDQQDAEWKVTGWCDYSYFPHYIGMNLDDKNAYQPLNQPKESYDTLTEAKKSVLNAYNIGTLTEFLNPAGENALWYPMWSYLNTWTSETDYGVARVNMDEVKHEYLPKVCMADDFEKAWEDYLKVFNERVDVKAYEDALTAEVKRRVDVAEGKEK
jgi:putative aldouronate transport system substrate-binding protein